MIRTFIILMSLATLSVLASCGPTINISGTSVSSVAAENSFSTVSSEAAIVSVFLTNLTLGLISPVSVSNFDRKPNILFKGDKWFTNYRIEVFSDLDFTVKLFEKFTKK